MPDESDEATLELANDLVSQRLETQKSGIERTETYISLGHMDPKDVDGGLLELAEEAVMTRSGRT